MEQQRVHQQPRPWKANADGNVTNKPPGSSVMMVMVMTMVMMMMVVIMVMVMMMMFRSDMFSLGQPDPVSVTYHKEVQIIFSMKEITKLNTEVED